MRKRSVGYSAVNKLQHAAALMCLGFVLSIAQMAAAKAETRTLKLYNTHTKERVEITFKKNGRYIPSALREANRFLRDWRRNEITKIDPELLDLVWEVYQQVDATKPIYVVSSYRSPATNNMLRSRSKGVAKHSQHMLGKAMDFYIPGVNLATLRKTGLRKQIGGVGYYPTSGSPFVHMDTGSVRHWPRMTRQQLAAVFPDGKTLHIPSDGKPLQGYKLALAEAKSGKKRSTPVTQVASAPEPRNRTTGQSLTNPKETTSFPSSNIFASLFGNKKSSETAERSRVVSVRPDSAPVPPGALPRARPSENSSPADTTAPVTEAPPIPLEKDHIVLAGIVPAPKPAHRPIQPVLAPVLASAAPNTLDAQRIALEQGKSSPSAAAASPQDGRIDVASAPAEEAVSERFAAAEQPQVLDPVSAIAAATGTRQPISKPASPKTLAYASATTLPTALALHAKVAQKAALSGDLNRRPPARPKQSVSGRIPLEDIKDPLAGFASLPDKSEPKLISGRNSARNRQFASLRHPFQRSMNNLLSPGNRFVRSGFERLPYGALRTDRFDGPAVIVLPVTYVR